MHVLATQPDLYGVLVDLNAVTTLLQLMGHENSDIIAATANLLQVCLFGF